MTSRERRQPSVLVAFVLLVLLGAGLGPSAASGSFDRLPAAPALGAATPGVQPAALVDTRAQAGVGRDHRDRPSHPLGAWASGAAALCAGRSLPGGAATGGRADRPRLRLQTCLRGPPRPSA